jgi:hypothetical protein
MNSCNICDHNIVPKDSTLDAKLRPQEAVNTTKEWMNDSEVCLDSERKWQYKAGQRQERVYVSPLPKYLSSTTRRRYTSLLLKARRLGKLREESEVRMVGLAAGQQEQGKHGP